jgi:hypothetical protein
MNNTDRTDALAAAYETLARRDKLMAMRAQMAGDKEQLVRHLEELRAALKKEEKDVDRLEGRSLAAVFYSLLGTRREHIMEEQEEALAARLKYDQAAKELEDVADRIGTLDAEMKTLDGCDERYARLFEEKKQRLTDEHGEAGQQILALSDDMGRAKAKLKEIREAMDAGNCVLAWLDSALESLRKAENWGTYDMLGGGLLASSVKHDHIDRAAECVSSAQLALNAFKSEMADTDIRCDIHVGVGDFARFADFFFDGLIADWHVQGTIEESLESVSAARSEVSSANYRLGSFYKTEQSQMMKIRTEIETLVKQSSADE